MGVSTENTYWSHQGKYQKESEHLDTLIPASGEMTKGSPIECLRVMNNMYYDLYNNGAGNTDVRGEEFEEMLMFLKDGGFLPDSKGVSQALDECLEFVREYMEASDNPGEWVEMEDGDEEWEEPEYPCSGNLYEPYEVLVSAIIELCMAVEDPTQPVTERPVY